MKDTKFKNGNPPWNKGLIGYRKGISRPQEVRDKISATRRAGNYGYTPYNRMPNVIITCGNCSKLFEVVYSRKYKAKYCCKACYTTSTIKREASNKGIYNAKTYGSLHYKIRKLKGTPSLCEVCGTTEAKKFEWANLTGNYEDINDYQRMCSSCHAIYDQRHFQNRPPHKNI